MATLEKKVDNVTWKGQLRYRYHQEWELDGNKNTRYTHQYITLRLEPSMQVNEHWSGHARIDYNSNMDTAANTPIPTPPMTTNARHLDTDIEYNGMRVERIWAEGNYGKLNIKLGKLPYTSNIDEGMMFDDNVAGGQITFGNKVKATITAGRSKRFDGELGIDPDEPRNNEPGDTGSYQAIEIYNDRADKWTWGVAYHHWANKNVLWEDTDATALNIYEIALGYKFNKNLRMHGAYSWTNDPSFDHDEDDLHNPVANPIFSHAKRSWSIELDYKKANPADKGSWGAFVAYRHLGHYSTIAPIYDTIYNGRRGVEMGVSYVFAKNLMGTVKYFNGDKMPDDDSVTAKPRDPMKGDSVLFGELNFFF